MNRRDAVLGLLCLGAAFGPSCAEAQAPRRIGVLLVTASCPTPSELVESLRALGWVEGQTVVYDCVSAIGRLKDVTSVATELVARRPDLIASGLIPAIRALKDATSTIPIVALGVADPVGQKLIASLSRPGGNLTGLVSVMFEVEEKRIDFLKEIMPSMARLAVVYRRGADSAYGAAVAKVLARAGGAHRFSYQWFYYEQAEDIPRLIDEIAAKRFDAAYFPPGPVTESSPAIVGKAALARRLPVIGQGENLADAGALLTYGPSRVHIAQRSASQIDKILRGAKPADLPFEQPSQFDLVINLKTAKALGLKIPQSVLIRANRVIE